MVIFKSKRERMGPVAQKLLLLLAAGVSLSLTHNPNRQFSVLKSAAREWQKINQRSLREAIRRLYKSEMVDYEESKDGTVRLVLRERGKKKTLAYNLDTMEIKKPKRWDGLWQLVIFDIPEDKKKSRDALARKLRQLGFLPLQKSVFVYPYECRDEINFIVEIFELKPYVRYIVANEIDVNHELRTKFNLSSSAF